VIRKVKIDNFYLLFFDEHGIVVEEAKHKNTTRLVDDITGTAEKCRVDPKAFDVIITEIRNNNE